MVLVVAAGAARYDCLRPPPSSIVLVDQHAGATNSRGRDPSRSTTSDLDRIREPFNKYLTTVMIQLVRRGPRSGGEDEDKSSPLVGEIP